MQTRRVAPVLNSVAQVRNWVAANVPLTDSLLGYDLFLKLGNEVLAGGSMELDSIAAGLPHGRDQVAAQLQLMAGSGLVELTARDGTLQVRPTPRFLTLVDTYSRVFQRHFIVRSDLRGTQLAVASTDPELREFAQLAYDRVYDLGWLYLHNYGSVCFLMASLLRRIAAEHGYDARVASCHVEISAPGEMFRLGAQGVAKPGQIDGHAAVVIGDRTVIDFGLGNVRKSYRRNFPWGACFDYRRNGPVLGGLAFGGDMTAVWKDDWQSPSTDSELERYAPLVDKLFAQYAERFLDR
jgi:hypothetical protein